MSKISKLTAETGKKATCKFIRNTGANILFAQGDVL